MERNFVMEVEVQELRVRSRAEPVSAAYFSSDIPRFTNASRDAIEFQDLWGSSDGSDLGAVGGWVIANAQPLSL